MSKPYKDIKIENFIIRKFNSSLQETDLKWHRDDSNRKITILAGNNWKFQLDNNIPFNLQKGKTYVIETKIWHRLIKGDDNLIIKIEEIQ